MKDCRNLNPYFIPIFLSHYRCTEMRYSTIITILLILLPSACCCFCCLLVRSFLHLLASIPLERSPNRTVATWLVFVLTASAAWARALHRGTPGPVLPTEHASKINVGQRGKKYKNFALELDASLCGKTLCSLHKISYDESDLWNALLLWNSSGSRSTLASRAIRGSHSWEYFH